MQEVDQTLADSSANHREKESYSLPNDIYSRNRVLLRLSRSLAHFPGVFFIGPNPQNSWPSLNDLQMINSSV